MSKKTRDAPNVSGLGQHAKQGKTLQPPLKKLENVVMQSWRNDRLPEVLWAAILAGNLERFRYLELFREVAEAARNLGEDHVKGIDHAEIADISDPDFDILFKSLLVDPDTKRILGALLLLEGLPDRRHWERHLTPAPQQKGFEYLASGVAASFDHQSEQATDCRWVRILVKLLVGMIILPERMAEFRSEILAYPNQGDMRSVRPMIRAMEGAWDAAGRAWPRQFWTEGLEKTGCIPASRDLVSNVNTAEILESLGWLYACVAAHFFENTDTTDVDPRKDATFGIVLYGLYISVGVIQSKDHQRPEGRIALRTLVECFIVLAFLLKKEDKTLWLRYRQYGVGQAKLAFLKLYDLEDVDVPSFINLDELEGLANEDAWQEFSDIELGQWAGADLRKMSQDAGVKEIYDKYYGWPSGYVHGHWGAVRDTVFDLCLNPLHRFHRIPNQPRTNMPSVAQDICKIINLLLDKLNQAYPTFKLRVGAKPPPELRDGMQQG